MSSQLTNNAEALRLFFTEDVYLVPTAGNVEDGLELSNEDVQLENTPQRTFTFLGKNEKQVLILVNDDDNEVSSEQGRTLLRNLVKAINLTANDFALVNYASCENAGIEAFLNFFKFKHLLAFGVSPSHLGLPDQALHQLVEQRGVGYLFTSNLHDLHNDPLTKRSLWASLQALKL